MTVELLTTDGTKRTEARDLDAWRALVRDFLRQELPRDWRGIGAFEGPEYFAFIETWRAKLYERGLLALSWPREYGGAELSLREQVAVYEEFARAGVPNGGVTDEFGIAMLGNTMLRWGSDAQKRRFLPPILSGEHRWCQGYSEPGAGSDLASLSCRAEKIGGDWVVNGQKLWTSAGKFANWIFLLARTEPGSQGHRGISFLLVPLDQPGVTLRPIKMLSGHEEFNEVFLDEARTAIDNVIGPVHEGWSVAMTLLNFERGGRAAQITVRFEIELERLITLTRERALTTDPMIRQELAGAFATVRVMRLLMEQELENTDAGRAPGVGAAIFKLLWSEYHQRVTEIGMRILGADGLVPTGRRPMLPFRADDPGAANSASSWVGVFFNARAGTIYAGTSEIQRNLIAERVLGLPRDRGGGRP